MYRWLETANVFHSGTVRLHRLHVLVEDGKDLVVKDLVLPNAVCHLLQWLSRQTQKGGGGGSSANESKKCVQGVGKKKSENTSCTHHIFDDFILAVLSLDFEKVIAEVKEVEAPLLSQKHDDGTAGPVQSIPKALPGRNKAHVTHDVSMRDRPKFELPAREVSVCFSTHYF